MRNLFNNMNPLKTLYTIRKAYENAKPHQKKFVGNALIYAIGINSELPKYRDNIIGTELHNN